MEASAAPLETVCAAWIARYGLDLDLNGLPQPAGDAIVSARQWAPSRPRAELVTEDNSFQRGVPRAGPPSTRGWGVRACERAAVAADLGGVVLGLGELSGRERPDALTFVSIAAVRTKRAGGADIAVWACVRGAGADALIWAASLGNEVLARRLVATGANVNHHGGRALAEAAERGDLSLGRFLLEEAATVLLLPADLSYDVCLYAPLPAAAAGGHLDFVRWLVQNHLAAVQHTVRMAWGRAVCTGHHIVAQFLLDYAGAEWAWMDRYKLVQCAGASAVALAWLLAPESGFGWSREEVVRACRYTPNAQRVIDARWPQAQAVAERTRARKRRASERAD